MEIIFFVSLFTIVVVISTLYTRLIQYWAENEIESVVNQLQFGDVYKYGATSHLWYSFIKREGNYLVFKKIDIDNFKFNPDKLNTLYGDERRKFICDAFSIKDGGSQYTDVQLLDIAYQKLFETGRYEKVDINIWTGLNKNLLFSLKDEIDKQLEIESFQIYENSMRDVLRNSQYGDTNVAETHINYDKQKQNDN